MSRNDMVKDFLNQFDEVRRQIELPKFLEGYHVLSCVYDGLEKSCYMVTDREADEKYLLKIRKCKNDRNVLGVEHQRICELAQAFPEEYKQSQYWKEGETEYLLKYYIQGMDLEKYQEQNRVLSTREVLRIVIEICKATARLHALTPPVLHRDIKPQNLIIDCSGKVHLIDFETTRTYKENKAKDTVFFGTEGNAAPEQYGYSQTDARTDVYGIGKVLEFLYQENFDCQTEAGMVCGKIQKIIKKAVAFDPEHRYQTVSGLQSDLERVMKKTDKRYLISRLRLIGAVEAVVAVILITSVFLMMTELHKRSDNADFANSEIQDTSKGKDTEEDADTAEPQVDTTHPEADNPGLVFDGGLEEALAVMLGKEEITEADYDKITKIVVYGNKVYGMDTDLQRSEMDICHRAYDEYGFRGQIDDLSELSKMKNLKEILLYDQNITDISPLKGLPIEGLYLMGNQIEDFSVVETMGELKILCIGDNPVSVMPDLSKCRHLETLSIENITCDNLDFLENSTIVALYIQCLYVRDSDFSVLARMPNLVSLYSARNQYAFYEMLPDLSMLKRLALWEYTENDLAVLKSLPNLEAFWVGGDMVTSMAGVENAANLEELCIDGTNITDISPVKSLHKLFYLKIRENKIEDYTPLFECDSLRIVSANLQQMDEINSIESNHMFQFVED